MASEPQRADQPELLWSEDRSPYGRVQAISADDEIEPARRCPLERHFDSCIVFMHDRDRTSLTSVFGVAAMVVFVEVAAPEILHVYCTRHRDFKIISLSLGEMSAPPAGFEPALPPPEGGALSPELRGPGETIYQREGPQPTRFYPRRVARRRRQRIDAALAGAVGLLLLAGCVHAAPPTPAVIRDAPPPWDAPRDAISYIEAATLVQQPLDSTENRHVIQVTITIDGAPVRIPAYVGVDRVRAVQAAVHTHDTSGAVWLEGRDTATITLGQFFTVWGVRFDDRCLGAACGGVRVRVDGTRVTADPRAVVLARSRAIDIAVSSA